MGFSIEVLNSVRANASDEYQNRIPEATQQNLLSIGQAFKTYTPLYNEFCSALLNKIGKTIIEQNMSKNRLAKFKAAGIHDPKDVEEIFIEQIKAEGSYDPTGANPLGRREGPDVQVVYHRQNRQDKYVISLGDLDFLRVFRNEGTLDAFLKGRLQAVYSAAEKDEWLCMKNLIATFGVEYDELGDQLNTPKYCEYEVPVITNDNAESAAKRFVKTLRKACLDVQFDSTEFNAAGVEIHTDPSHMTLLINKDVLAEVDVEVLAKAMNMGKTDIQVSIIPMDDFGDNKSGDMADTYGLLIDNNWFRVYDTLFHMEPQRNADGLFTNYFLHVHQILSASPFKTAIRLKAV